jgi:ABC-type sugar transport system permease subunit
VWHAFVAVICSVLPAVPEVNRRSVALFERMTPFLFILPALVLYLGVVLLPSVGTTFCSFCEIRAGLGWRWIGLRNYSDVFAHDDIFMRALLNNFLYLLATLVVEVLFGLVMALILNQKRPGFHVFRILFFTPMMLSLVVVGLIWKFVYHPSYGILNQSLKGVGLDALALPWLADPRTALGAVCIVSGWIYAGFYMVLFYAGLQRIPASLLEGARIDGASEIQCVRHISIPLLREVIVVCLLICATGAFKAFDLFYVMTPDGGPDHASEVVATWLVRESFDNNHLGYGSALAVIMTVLVFLLTLIYQLFQRRREALEF